MCSRENAVHLFNTFHLKISQRFDEIKDGDEPESIKISEVTL